MGNIWTLKNLFLLAGLLHFMQLPAMLAAPRMLDWKSDLAKLSPINRRIVQVIGIGIMIMLMGAGAVVVSAPETIAEGGRLATAFCAYLTVVWAYRGAVQIILYSRLWPTGFWGRASHYGLCVLMAFLTGVYFVGFLNGIVH